MRRNEGEAPGNIWFGEHNVFRKEQVAYWRKDYEVEDFFMENHEDGIENKGFYYPGFGDYHGIQLLLPSKASRRGTE